MNETNLVVTHENRIKLLNLQTAMQAFNAQHNLPEPECPVTHHFAPGVYGREIFIPAGTMIIGKIHKHAHLNILVQGRVSVKTNDGILEYVAPMVMVSEAGTKRALFIHEDTIWVTVHVNETNTQDLDIIEDYVIAKSFEEFDKFVALGHDSTLLLEARETL